MRNALVTALLSLSDSPRACFLTGDLGFMALEPLRAAFGERFINAGISEQNMISVAAGLARAGMRPWVYSIAPFCYARPFEQIRNDVALHALPVRLLGNGAGYGYGVQGPTHHALEDCAVMGSLQNMRVYAPAFVEDLAALVALLDQDDRPAYLRLGRDERPAGASPPPYAPFRKLLVGQAGLVIALGALAGALWEALRDLPSATRPELWCCCQLPGSPVEFPGDLLLLGGSHPWVMVVEEHVAWGGLGACYALAALLGGRQPRRFIHKHALGYPGGRYGSQRYHRAESGIAPQAVRTYVLQLNEGI